LPCLGSAKPIACDAKTTLDTYGHIWPDRDESTRAAVEAVLIGRTEHRRKQASKDLTTPQLRAGAVDYTSK
jgi:hypothetical protein